ncbi:MAG: 4'-phosphopantetheinyl transferase superfamily protein [Ilumatobacter sp.]|uniref:4'-phosphopantetheinyl transferase family protein n=1 Tax=Ilumatobacter sp. TaxID=1967498 RepID=UPI002615987C|nr:4'-phosphopantetheinyl transferase superfamily protein [Ilumatobacter sp.]MDJ0767178.1 4'-phosphopantetheinyl transferase superfamily protein [Ilumatobacter sp.]
MAPQAAGLLDDDVVEVWLARPGEFSDRVELAALERLLADDERERHRRFRREQDRHTFLVAHALVRTVLGRYTSVEPAELRFVLEEHGRPQLAPEHGGSVRFNLSHTDGMVACAVTVGRSVGVDVQVVDDRVATMEVARRVFAPTELADVGALTGADRRERFFRYWTLKEAYIKATGLGLSTPLDRFAFDLADPISVAFAAELDDDPRCWQFAQSWPTDRHCLAVAVRRSGADVALRVRDAAALTS